MSGMQDNSLQKQHSAPTFNSGVNFTMQMRNNTIGNQGGSNYTFGNNSLDCRHKVDMPATIQNIPQGPIEEEKKEHSYNNSLSSENKRER